MNSDKRPTSKTTPVTQRAVWWVALICGSLLLAACVAAPAAPTPETRGGPGSGLVLSQDTGTLIVDHDVSVTLTWTPWPPKTLAESQATITVTQGGKLLEGLHPVLDLTMPGMVMPENRPAVQETQPGRYAATPVLTMGGRWQVDVVLDLASGPQIASFLFDAVE